MMEQAINMAVAGAGSATLGAGLSLISKMVNMSAESKRLANARNAEELKIVMESQDRASKRGGTAGDWVRRFIVLSLFGFLFGLLAFNGMLSHWFEQVPATYAFLERTEPRFFGLLRGRQVLRTVPLEGIPVFSQAVNMMWLIGTFYFGSSRIK